MVTYNYDLILEQSKEIILNYNNFINKKYENCKTHEQFKELMCEKYDYLYNNFKTIFTQCINGNMDINLLTYMIVQIKDIEQNKISNHNASIKVGEKLVEKYVKPLINKKR